MVTNTSDWAVDLQGVVKTYSDAGNSRTILDNLFLQLKAGDFVSITGPSGSGKSTLLNIIGGVDQPDRGIVRILDQDIAAKNESARTLFRRHHVGYVFQFFNLIPTLTVEENLRLPLELCQRQFDSSLIDQWLERFTLTDRAASYPDTLSGGEQQRVAVIRAAIHQPAVLLADEPTGNLDGNAGAAVLQALEEIADAGTCIIMATHSDTAASAAGSRLHFANGQLKAV